MRILFFAHVRDMTGCAEIELQLGAGGVNVDALWRLLLSTYPGLEKFRGSVRLARNGEYVGSDALFTETDEVALIPPVSGG